MNESASAEACESLFRPPRPRSGDGHDEERHATWLELFFDLVFVAAIAQLARFLRDDFTLGGSLRFVALFVPVWWAWVGHTFYLTRFDSDDLGHRLFALAQMATVAVLAVQIPHAFAETSVGFALAYATVRLLLVGEYCRAHRAIAHTRPLTRRYIRGFGAAGVLWVVSVFVPAPARFAVWGIAMIVDFGTPLTAGTLHVRFPPHTSHIPERFGLFTIIVLGEAVIDTVAGVGHGGFGAAKVVAAICGLALAFSIWWIYFERARASSHRKVRAASQIHAYQQWLYSHLPLALGITAVGVGVERIIASHSWEPMAMEEALLLAAFVLLIATMLESIHCASIERVDDGGTFFRLGPVFLAAALAPWIPQPLALVAFALAMAPAVSRCIRRVGAVTP